MDKIEAYIRQNLRHTSNKNTCYDDNGFDISSYYPWLTADDAKEIAKIVREDTIEKAYQWLNKFYKQKLGYKSFEEVAEDLRRTLNKN